MLKWSLEDCVWPIVYGKKKEDTRSHHSTELLLITVHFDTQVSDKMFCIV